MHQPELPWTTEHSHSLERQMAELAEQRETRRYFLEAPMPEREAASMILSEPTPRPGRRPDNLHVGSIKTRS